MTRLRFDELFLQCNDMKFSPPCRVESAITLIALCVAQERGGRMQSDAENDQNEIGARKPAS
jgi:hypothetical protein